ncbi:hypothetical protein M422DRAFT_257392 [Sphaerobolus stellatus SS14]|uniref:Uncharacterized protein n=1 Tax=Sphaerobolus stellatus (strain SS14) TaxID=990650 RepID=A0A0C9VPM2_SPHS4|nr:hypothetical protein M422DRAFT_257392 [Sphaerobolus stellatus SS14]
MSFSLPKVSLTFQRLASCCGTVIGHPWTLYSATKGGPAAKLDPVVKYSMKRAGLLESLGIQRLYVSGQMHRHKDKRPHFTVHGMREDPNQPGTWKALKTLHVYSNGGGTIREPYKRIRGKKVEFITRLN